VEGTRNVIAASRACGVRRLVYTSSPSVVFNGCNMEGVDESVPYADRFESPYPATKATAEQLVLGANDSGLATVALRPHLIWGPGDNHLIPRIIARAKAGRLRRIGRENHLVDTTYIDDAAEAHLLAAARLEPGAAIGGRAFFLSQGEPWPLWDLVNAILSAAVVPPVNRAVSRSMALAAATVLETVYRALRLSGEPPMTRFLVHQLSSAHWFNIDAARRDLGYKPRVSIDDGLRRLEAAFRGATPAHDARGLSCPPDRYRRKDP
jgi:nucleoside-diphosphate-sugar epimerase